MDNHNTTRQRASRFDTVRQSFTDILSHNQAVHHDFNGMLFIFIWFNLFGQLIEQTIHTHTDIATPARVLKYFLILSLFPTHHWRENLDTTAHWQGENLVEDLVNGLLPNLFPTDGTVWCADTRPQQAQVVVNFCYGSYGRAWIFARGFLVDGDSRGQTVNIVHIGLLHLSEKHPCIRGQALHIATLSLGIDGIKGERGLTRARKPCHHHQFVAWNLHINIFQIVLPRTLDINFIVHRRNPFLIFTPSHHYIRCRGAQ